MGSNEKVEVYILCGFLGGGKSTLLTRLIQFEQQQGRKIGVIMNELGEVSIDSSFIPAELPLRELSGGCICCSLQDDLSYQIEQLIGDYHLDALYIESTGAAEPHEILDACTDPSVAGRIQIRAVVTVLDAKLWDGRAALKPEIGRLLEAQLKYADVILLNKMDTLSDVYPIEKLMEPIRKLNPQALILPAVQAIPDPSIIGSAERVEHKPAETPEKAHVHHHLHLHSFTFSPAAPLDRRTFEEWLNRYAGELHRAKGYLRLTGKEGLFLFQYANEQLLFTRFLIEPGCGPVMVFIGQGLDAEKLKSELLILQSRAETA